MPMSKFAKPPFFVCVYFKISIFTQLPDITQWFDILVGRDKLKIASWLSKIYVHSYK